jgi:hypothetical protein
MLATLKISKVVGKNGHEITPAPGMTTGLERYVGSCSEADSTQMLKQANGIFCATVTQRSFLVCLSLEMREL